MKLLDPEICHRCRGRGRVIDSRKRRGYRRRIYACRKCNITWPAWLSRINPRRVTRRSV